MIKAVFFDIDGTLVSFKTHTIPESTVKALNLLKEQGIKIFIATGRAFQQIKHVNGFDFDGYVTYNGAYCLTAEKEPIFKNPVPQTDVDNVVSYLKTNNDSFGCSFMTNEGTFVNVINERVAKIADLVNLPLPEVMPLEEAAKKEVLQINLFVDEADEVKIMKEVFTNSSSNRWHHLFTDVNIKGNSKATGIDKVIAHYGIDLSETMAFGDGGNDLEMLQHVPFGIAMGNAEEHVKAVAHYVTSSVDDDGIWNALVHFNVINAVAV